MMTKDQSEIVRTVYLRFIESEEESWGDLDSHLENIAEMSDEELIAAVATKSLSHSKGIRCQQDHDPRYCFAPFILEAVESILELFIETNQLHEKNKYILSFYLAMAELGLIF